MPAIANVVIADAVPANKTLSPLAASVALSKWLQREAAIAAGNRTLDAKLSLATAQRPTDRVTFIYGVPRIVNVDGVDVVDSIARYVQEWVIPITWTDAERNNFQVECKNLASHAIVASYVRSRDAAY